MAVRYGLSQNLEKEVVFILPLVSQLKITGYRNKNHTNLKRIERRNSHHERIAITDKFM
jgi:hypothetical protein